MMVLVINHAAPEAIQMLSPSAEVTKCRKAETHLRALHKKHGENAVSDTINKWRRERMAAKRTLRDHGRNELARILGEEGVLLDCISMYPEHADFPHWKSELVEVRKQIRAELDPTIITRSHAEQALRRITMQFADYVDSSSEYGSPKLYDHEHEGLRPGCWSIAWEGGPYDWTQQAFQQEVGVILDLYRECPQGILAEPYNNCILYLYPQD